MADLEAVKFVESYKLETFITDGLNSGKFGHGAVEILSEIYVLERDDVAPVVHARWIDNTYCSNCRHFEEDFEGHIVMSFGDYCPCCGAKMDERKSNE